MQAWIPALQTWASKSPNTFTIVSGVLPPAISAFFGFILPKIMRRLAKYQGAVCAALNHGTKKTSHLLRAQLTRSRLDRAVVARYFGFLVASQLIIFTLIGVLYRELNSLDQPYSTVTMA